MLFDGKNPVTGIIGVEHLKWNSGVFQVAPRGYSALAFRIKGDAVITVDDRNYSVTPSDVLYLPQKLAYRAQYSDTEVFVIHFVTAQDDSCPEVYSVGNSQQIYQAFLRIHSLWQSKTQGYSVYGMSQLYHVLGLICDKQTKINMPPCFLAAISYIHSNFKDNGLSIGLVCRNAGIGQTNFRQQFQKHYQKTPVEYITNLRLEYARNLIANGMAIENAAMESGFNDPKYFARIVKKYFDCTPRELKTYGK